MASGAVRLHELCAGNPDHLAWLREHDLDPNRVALGHDEGPFVVGNQMTVWLYLEDTNGRRYIDPTTGGAAVEVRTIALLRPPPDLHFVDGRPFPATVPA